MTKVVNTPYNCIVWSTIMILWPTCIPKDLLLGGQMKWSSFYETVTSGNVHVMSTTQAIVATM